MAASILLSIRLAPSHAAPSPHELLPRETVVVVTLPDFSKASDLYSKEPIVRFWNDPAMRPFREKFLAKMHESWLAPIEKQLGATLTNYLALLKGQITFALTLDTPPASGDSKSPQGGWLLILDTMDRSADLQKLLSDARTKMTDAGFKFRIEKIRDAEFVVFRPSNEWTQGILGSKNQEPPAADAEPAAGAENELWLGQSGSFLLMGDTRRTLEIVLTRTQGGTAPTLADSPEFTADFRGTLRNAYGYGWIHFKTILDQVRQEIEKETQPSPASPIPSPAKIFGALGFDGLKSLSFALSESPDGSLFSSFVRAPSSERRGLLSLLAPDPKDASPPAFVTSTVSTFSRVRKSGKEAWATLEKLVAELSPPASGVLEMTLQALGKDLDPNFDFKKQFIGNLGDDFILYQNAPRGDNPAEVLSPPSLWLIGSPNPTQLIGAIRALASLAPMPGAATQIREREFLGRRIFTFQMPNLAPTGDAAQATLGIHFAATTYYVALTDNAALIEDYIRTQSASESPLRDRSGLADAARSIDGMQGGFFAYQNDETTLRAIFALLKNESDPFVSMLLGAVSPPGETNGFNIKDWLDFSLLPAFDSVSRFFHFSIYSGSANDEGFTLKWFSPIPPGLRNPAGG